MLNYDRTNLDFTGRDHFLLLSLRLDSDQTDYKYFDLKFKMFAVLVGCKLLCFSLRTGGTCYNAESYISHGNVRSNCNRLFGSLCWVPLNMLRSLFLCCAASMILLVVSLVSNIIMPICYRKITHYIASSKEVFFTNFNKLTVFFFSMF